MKIDQIIRMNGKTLAVCSGEHLHPGLRCSKIQIDGRTVPVLDFCVKETFTAGIMAAYLTLPNDAEVHTGKITIVA